MAACSVTSEAETRTKTLADASSLSNHLGIHASASMYILSMTCPSFSPTSPIYSVATCLMNTLGSAQENALVKRPLNFKVQLHSRR